MARACAAPAAMRQRLVVGLNSNTRARQPRQPPPLPRACPSPARPPRECDRPLPAAARQQDAPSASRPSTIMLPVAGAALAAHLLSWSVEPSSASPAAGRVEGGPPSAISACLAIAAPSPPPMLEAPALDAPASPVQPSTLAGASAGGSSGGSGGSGDVNTASTSEQQQQQQQQQQQLAVACLLDAAHRGASSFPPDVSAALAAGRVPPDLLLRYLQLDADPLASRLLPLPGFRERLLSDSSFLVKLGIELGIGMCTKVTAELTKRGPAFWGQVDFVLADVIMALIADFMLTWLPAPTVVLAVPPPALAPPGGGGAASDLVAWFATCPDNAFQRVLDGQEPFSVGQRFGAIVRNGAKLFVVGTLASLTGVSITNGIIRLRRRLNPAFVPPNPPQNVVKMALAYGTYMTLSSNLRYQIVAGVIEQRGIEVLFAGNVPLCRALSLVVRTANTFLGSCLWVDFIRFVGLQPKSELAGAADPQAAPPTATAPAGGAGGAAPAALSSSSSSSSSRREVVASSERVTVGSLASRRGGGDAVD